MVCISHIPIGSSAVRALPWYGMAWYGMAWYGMVWYGSSKTEDGGTYISFQAPPTPFFLPNPPFFSTIPLSAVSATQLKILVQCSVWGKSRNSLVSSCHILSCHMSC